MVSDARVPRRMPRRTRGRAGIDALHPHATPGHHGADVLQVPIEALLLVELARLGVSEERVDIEQRFCEFSGREAHTPA